MSNTSATDTDTQFHMSSDSGSKVQLDQGKGQGAPSKPSEGGGARPKLSATLHSQLGRKSSGGSLFGTAELAQDFVMIDLKTPFATQG